MKKDIILAGVGGQGIISIAATIGYAAIESGLNLKQSEVHGMSQRGGDVSSHFRLSDREIASDLIPFGKGDIIISVEPMEALKYLPYLSSEGWLITNTNPYLNIQNYPDISGIMNEINSFKNHIAIDADDIAKKLGSPKSSNMVILGAAYLYLDMEYENFKKAIITLFKSKGDAVINANLEAFDAGRFHSNKKI